MALTAVTGDAQSDVAASLPKPGRPSLSRSRRSWVPHRPALVIVLIGALVTGALGYSSRGSYLHSEQRLSNLQVQLTVSALGIAQVEIEQRLGQALDLASQSPDPAGTFDRELAPALGPKKLFASAGLELIHGDSVDVLSHIGARAINSPTGKAAFRDFEEAVHSASLVTTRAIGHGQQRLGYLLSITTAGGTYVAGAGQSLPRDHRVKVPSDSPDADLNFAIYFGRSTAPSDLLETTVSHLPLAGQISKGIVPFGSNVLTIVAVPKHSLEGTWPELLPWGIGLVGVLFTILVVAMTERLARRRESAESLAEENEKLFQEQRGVAEALQRSLLPDELPQLTELGLAVRYMPGVVGTEVGGDWYDVVQVDDKRVFFSVGDVSGRGLGAATLMATLRHTINAYALEGGSPDSILTRSGRLIDVRKIGHFATVVCGTIDLLTGEAIISNAGHPPPLLIVDGIASYVEVIAEPPVGVAAGVYTSVTLALPEHSILLAFTDGLVERRGESLGVGLERLRRSTQNAPSIEAIFDDVISTMVPDGASDDIAMLGLQWRR